MKQKQRKGQAGVGTLFSLGHRWRGEQNVRLRLGGHVKEGVVGMSVHICPMYVCWGWGVGVARFS